MITSSIIFPTAFTDLESLGDNTSFMFQQIISVPNVDLEEKKHVGHCLAVLMFTSDIRNLLFRQSPMSELQDIENELSAYF